VEKLSGVLFCGGKSKVSNCQRGGTAKNFIVAFVNKSFVGQRKSLFLISFLETASKSSARCSVIEFSGKLSELSWKSNYFL
jgi:hypothetical protein